VSGTRESYEAHQGDEVADVEALGRRVEAAVSRDRALREMGGAALSLLMKEPAPAELVVQGGNGGSLGRHAG
jgi:hypothetical protein